jgi:hypothetical protein
LIHRSGTLHILYSQWNHVSNSLVRFSFVTFIFQNCLNFFFNEKVECNHKNKAHLSEKYKFEIQFKVNLEIIYFWGIFLALTLGPPALP